jgi:hypothetical protein
MIIKRPINLANVDPARPIADHPLNRGLVAWWMALANNDGGSRLYDLGGRYHGTLPGAPSTGTGIVRRPASRANGYGELGFDADSQQNLPLGDLSGEFAAQDATVACWIKFRNATPTVASKTGLFNFGTDFGSDNTNFPWLDGNMYISVFDEQRIAALSGVPAPPNRDQWNHLAFRSAAGSGQYKVYWNGDFFAAGTRNTFFFPPASWLGQSNDNYWFDGWIDDVRLANRAWSDAEVAEVYRESLADYPSLLNRRPFYWYAPAASPGFTISEDWDGVTAPAVPSGWNVDPLYTTSSAHSYSSPNALKLGAVTPGTPYFATNSNADPGGGAVVDLTSYVYLGDIAENADNFIGPTFRCSASTMDDSSTSCYWVRLYINPVSVSPYLAFSSVIDGVVNDVFVLTDTSNGLVPGVWFSIRVTSDGGDVFNVTVTRLSDGYTLNSDGAFTSTPSVAIANLHATAVASGAYYGVAAATATSDLAYFDDFNVNSEAPPPPELVYPRRPVIARVPFQFYIVD